MTKPAATRRPVPGLSPELGRLLRGGGAVARATWQGRPEEGLPPVPRLRRPGWLGQVRISGSTPTPVRFRPEPKGSPTSARPTPPTEARNRSRTNTSAFPGDLFDPDDGRALDRAADTIAHLPVVLPSGLYDGMEDGLARTEPQPGASDDGWSLIEAYVRLGLVPPANVLYLPHIPDPTRPERLTAYVVAAYLRAACHPK